MFVTLLLAEEREEPRQILRWKCFGRLPKAEKQHIQITRRVRGLCQPAKLVAKVRDCVLCENVFDLPEQRSRAPQRHAIVVQKLGIEISAYTRLVGDHDVEQSPVDLA